MLVKIFCLFVIMASFTNNVFAKNQQPYTDTTLTIKVKGVTCSGDLKTLSENVKALKGVSNCVAGKAGATSSFKVTYNPLLISLSEIHKAFENTEGCSDPKDRPYKVKTK